MNKKLFAVAIAAVLLAGCGKSIYSSTLFPGAEAEMISLCAPNGGFVSGTATNSDIWGGGRYARLQEYATTYRVECGNGAVIQRQYHRPAH